MSRQQRAQQQALGAASVASQIPTITEEAVRHAYHEVSSHYKCDGGCGIAETKAKQHLQCSRCTEAKYCSKECQRSHWKVHKGICNLNSSYSKNARWELFQEKYNPMMQLATSWELDESAEEMVMIFELEDLPVECKAPRLGITSFRQESIRYQQDSIQEYHTEYLIHAPPSDGRKFALVRWTTQKANGEPIMMIIHIPFDVALDKEDESAHGILQASRGLPRDTQNGGCHQEASKCVNTINDMARGRNKKLSKAAKPRRR
jgi:hypothetical protein